eukprot:5220577-Ditylum_brightwellii.AAC.1
MTAKDTHQKYFTEKIRLYQCKNFRAWQVVHHTLFAALLTMQCIAANATAPSVLPVKSEPLLETVCPQHHQRTLI